MSLTVLIVTPVAYSGLAWAEIVKAPVFNATTSTGNVYNLFPYFGYTILFIGIVITALIPGNKRVLQLERSHRDFHITINDVVEAYYRAHTADRKSTFQLPGEFDGVRDRFEFLKSQPDLRDLEPEILTLAAQMSYTTRKLAVAFNDETVLRAQDFIQQRKYELDRGKERITAAL